LSGYDFVNDRVEADDDTAPTLLVRLPNPPTTAMAWLELPTASLMPLKVLSNYGGGTADIGSDQVCR